MAVRSPARSPWLSEDRPPEPLEEGWAERLARWLLVYLAALLTSLAVGGSAWALGLTR
jgi:hypothetical protein